MTSADVVRADEQIDQVTGAITGDGVKEASGKITHDAGVAQTELNKIV